MASKLKLKTYHVGRTYLVNMSAEIQAATIQDAAAHFAEMRYNDFTDSEDAVIASTPQETIWES
jgi:hypothetical protein